MTLQNLIHCYDWNEIKNYLPHEEEFDRIWIELNKMTPYKNPGDDFKDSNIPNDIKLTVAKYEEFDAVIGWSETKQMRFALVYDRWEYWLGLEIIEDLFTHIDPQLFIAMCLVEMTQEGWTQREIREARRRFLKNKSKENVQGN